MTRHAVRILGFLAAAILPACAGAPTVTTVREPGQGVSWCRANNQVACYTLGAEGYFRIRLMNPDGSGDRPLFETWPAGLPRKHQGTADWHPSGRYLIFTVEKDDHPGSSTWSIPGRGAYNDLWAATADGRSVTRLTNLPVDVGRGIIIPHFSRDGRRVGPVQADRGDRYLGLPAPRVIDLLQHASRAQLRIVDHILGGAQGSAGHVSLG